MRFFEEVAQREDRNDREIVLYPEGLFYKAYERSAFVCVSRISSFVPSKKRVRYLGRDLVSIGFPVSALAKYFPDAPRPQENEPVVIALSEPIDPVAAETWKAALPLKERMPRGGRRAALQARQRAAELGAEAAEVNALPAGSRSSRATGAVAESAAVRRQEEVSGSEEVAAAGVSAGRKSRVRGFRAANDPALSPRIALRAPSALSVRRERETKAERILRLIRDYRLEAATPVECVLFIADLKKEVDGYL
ncbi:MAG: hypothetical protein K2N04_04805 [Alistipes sp.]|nr:hypothetical protein [Alistipes sp.]